MDMTMLDVTGIACGVGDTSRRSSAPTAADLLTVEAVAARVSGCRRTNCSPDFVSGCHAHPRDERAPRGHRGARRRGNRCRVGCRRLWGHRRSDTLGNVARAVGGLSLPNLQRAGLGGVAAIEGMPPASPPTGAFGLMEPSSAGKDSTTGHWEIAGLRLKTPFPTYPDGFPQRVIDEFAARTGREVICTEVGSGTDILDRWAETHVRTGAWIVYTSADSVFQLAAHGGRRPAGRAVRRDAKRRGRCWWRRMTFPA